jgi:hypothetical protein
MTGAYSIGLDQNFQTNPFSHDVNSKFEVMPTPAKRVLDIAPALDANGADVHRILAVNIITRMSI